ncbi:Werner Syndrome-like exonuclease isoform X1 [Olea europaea subsp. europaea]|uniref:3'-5' exonuclease n=1 Tax=Olea europaea subsp. europaea TaxID=158383 RepID=A0A8S0UIK8_OLEEU|nr:Werner Syndrome-like exonuclease isoform X1 [Olea europaea subsp. europaea]
MGAEPSISDSDWDRPFTDEELEAIDAICRSATTISSSSSSSTPIKKRHVLECTNDHASTVSPPKTRRRLPESLFTFRKEPHTSFSFSPCSRNRFNFRNNTVRSPYQDMKFGGRIVYSRTVEEVEKAADELLHFIEAKKSKEGKCILGLDIEWKPTFRKGVAPGKAEVLQICGDNNNCYVLHIIHSGIPQKLRFLLEDPTSLKVGIGIANDADKVFQDHNVSIMTLEDLSNLANWKLSGVAKRWSLASLTEMVICRQLPKPNKIRLGNWEVEVLSKEQLKYAATDAYVSWYLYQVLKSFPEPVDNKSETTCPESNDHH